MLLFECIFYVKNSYYNSKMAISEKLYIDITAIVVFADFFGNSTKKGFVCCKRYKNLYLFLDSPFFVLYEK